MGHIEKFHIWDEVAKIIDHEKKAGEVRTALRLDVSEGRLPREDWLEAMEEAIRILYPGRSAEYIMTTQIMKVPWEQVELLVEAAKRKQRQEEDE